MCCCSDSFTRVWMTNINAIRRFYFCTKSVRNEISFNVLYVYGLRRWKSMLFLCTLYSHRLHKRRELRFCAFVIFFVVCIFIRQNVYSNIQMVYKLNINLQCEGKKKNVDAIRCLPCVSWMKKNVSAIWNSIPEIWIFKIM